MSSFTLSGLPGELQWKNQPVDSKVEFGTLTIGAGELTDWFIDPSGVVNKGNAPIALFAPPDEQFTLRARVSVDFEATFDAGVLFVYESETSWAKLCFELSPQGKPMVVSVVTKGSSDDCNSLPIEGSSIYLRVARQGQAFAFHYSLDGRVWNLVRYFSLGALSNLQMGLSSQAPTGTRCSATFAEVEYRQGALKDIRSTD
jgi:regulation of enolase protein 1 (concanavalin A-like superfamily)